MAMYPPPDFHVRFMRLSMEYCENCIKYGIKPNSQIKHIKTPLKNCYINLILDATKRSILRKSQIYDRNDFYRMLLLAFMQDKYFKKYG